VIPSQARRVVHAAADGSGRAVPVAVQTAVVGADVHVTNHASGALDLVLTPAPVHLLGRAAETGLPDDVRAVTPAPVVDRAALVTALAAGAPGGPDWSAFRKRLCARQDGHAAERAADAVQEAVDAAQSS